MKKTKIILPLMVVFLTLAMSVSALTIVTPSSGGTATGTYNFTAISYEQPCNCTFETTADGVFAIFFNDSSGNEYYSIANDTTTITDASSTTLNITCYMSNATVDTATVTMAVDNTNPTARLTMDAVTQALKYYEVDCSQSSDAIDTSLTYEIQLMSPDGTEIGTNQTTSVANWDDGDLEELGEHTVSCKVTDNGNNSNIAQGTVHVKSKASLEETPIEKTKEKTNYLLYAGLFVVFMGAVVGILIKLSGKKE